MIILGVLLACRAYSQTNALSVIREAIETREELTQAVDKCEALQLSGTAMESAEAVVLQAQIELIQGRPAEAEARIIEKIPSFLALESALLAQKAPVRQISPIAGARYVLGGVYEESGDLKAALTEYLHAYVKYCDSPWSAPAGDAAHRLVEQLEPANKVTIQYGALRRQLVYAEIQRADRAVNSDQAKAIAIYRNMLELFPTHPLAPRNLLILAQLEPDEKEAHLSQLIETYPSAGESSKAFHMLTWPKYKAKQYADCIPLFERWIAHQKNPPPEPYFGLGACYFRARQYEKARAVFSQTEGLIPDDHALAEKSIYLQARCFAEQDRAPAAHAEFSRLLERYPETDLAAKTLARQRSIALNAGNFARALAFSTQLTDSFSAAPESKNALASLLTEPAVRDVAFDAMLTRANQIPDESFIFAGELFFEENDPKRAATAFAVCPHLERGLWGVTRANAALRKSPESSVAALLEKFPQTAYRFDAQFLLAEYQQRAGQSAEALATLDLLLNGSDSAEVQNRANYLIGQWAGDPKRQLAALLRFTLLCEDAEATRPQLILALEQSVALCEQLNLKSEKQNAEQQLLALKRKAS